MLSLSSAVQTAKRLISQIHVLALLSFKKYIIGGIGEHDNVTILPPSGSPCSKEFVPGKQVSMDGSQAHSMRSLKMVLLEQTACVQLSMLQLSMIHELFTIHVAAHVQATPPEPATPFWIDTCPVCLDLEAAQCNIYTMLLSSWGGYECWNRAMKPNSRCDLCVTCS